MDDETYIQQYISWLIEQSHCLICERKEEEIIEMLHHERAKLIACDVYQRAQSTEKIDKLFFIWIGAINDRVIEYIDVWRTSNDGYSCLTLYYDSGYFLFGELKQTLNILYGVEHGNTKEIISAQNDFYRRIKKLMNRGYCFDTALIMLVSMTNPATALTLCELKKTNHDYFTHQRMGINYIDIKNQNDLFVNGFYRNAYDLELTLRGNAAAASDIIRLLILYKNGGMYIDVDTLPSLNLIFGDIPSGINPNIINIVRSEYYLRRLRKVNQCFESHNTDVSKLEKYLHENYPSVLALLNKKIDSAKELSLRIYNPTVYKNSLMIASFDNISEFNNNIMVASKGSRIVRIILRELRKRYRHLFKKNYHMDAYEVSGDATSMSRLSNYRYDGILHLENNVTLFLSGPSLILEVLIGVTYSILDFNKEASPLAVSYALNSELARVSYREHTNYTPEHVRSSWY
ncbi:TcdA/TcdB catalytic glycosyltransferase domain-containing protein [Aeromonas jandaei]